MGVDCEQCSCRLISRLQRPLTMHSGSKVLIFIVVGACQAARQLRVPADPLRGERSLLNTFPFSAIEDQESSQASRFAPSQNLKPRVDRQGSDATDVSFAAVAAASPGGDGKRCIDKVEMVEETEYDEVVQCDHSYDRRCHTTYVTNYESQQEEECEENFRKNCFINYEKIAFNETVQVCRTPLVKDCMCRDLRSVELSMNLSAGPSRRSMMLKMMLLNVRPSRMRSVRMKPPDTPHSLSVLSGQEKCVM